MVKDKEQPEIFEVKATKCKRCGGILLSKFGLENGYGHVCKRKVEKEKAALTVDENQLTLFSESNKTKRGDSYEKI